jgi:hypothetical protein
LLHAIRRGKHGEERDPDDHRNYEQRKREDDRLEWMSNPSAWKLLSLHHCDDTLRP